jgi:hypothetical protein
MELPLPSVPGYCADEPCKEKKGLVMLSRELKK